MATAVLGGPPGAGGPMGAIAPGELTAANAPGELTAANAPGELTAANAPGVSSAVNRDHAPCHPSGVSGHHSIDGGRGAPAGQMP
jgi:hypothetical protein